MFEVIIKNNVEPKTAFSAFDHDKDGKISVDELELGLK